MKLTYDYYRVEVPADITDFDERNRIAFLMAEEKTRIYASTCFWKILSDDGSIVKVRRLRINVK